MAILFKPNILYSTNSYLAYVINTRFYHDKHYVYCSPKSGCKTLAASLIENPPSSRPIMRYKQLKEEAIYGEMHGLIATQRTNILTGVMTKFSKGVISEQEKNSLVYMVEIAQNYDFRPLLYLIPYKEVKGMLIPVDAKKRASIYSEEYIIEELPGEKFDILDLNDF
jgi:hypothetical protein